jgi:hypothetical protein
MALVTVLPVAASAYRWMIAVPTVVSKLLSCGTAGIGAALLLRMERNVVTAGVLNAGSV